MVGKRAEAVLNRAVKYAVEHQQEYFTLEHVLWSLLEEDDIIDIIKACGGDFKRISNELDTFLKQVPPANKVEGDESESAFTTAFEHPVATLNVQRLVQRAIFQVQSSGKDEIQPEDLFVALFQAKDSPALSILKKQNINRLDVINYLSHGEQKVSDNREAASEHEENASKSENFKSKRPDALELFTTNLNKLAREGKIDPLIGREKELERIIQVLCRRQKNHPLLVGEAGVGKTALAEGLALKVIKKEVPEILNNVEIYALDMGSLIAGTKFRGDFEDRLKKVLKTLQKLSEKGVRPILLIDEIHTIVGAGTVSGGSLDAANLLKPFLVRGNVQCMGSTTYREYRSVFEKDHALSRRFQKIDVDEPTEEQAIKILEGLKVHYEDFHNVEYKPEVIKTSVELSHKHLSERFLPDNAIDVIDEAGARMRLKYPEKTGAAYELSIEDVEEVVATMARVPSKSVSSSQKTRLKYIDRDLKLTIFGQDHAIDALTTAIRMSRSGLRSGEHPVGSFLFSGPTGVGKTELAIQLSHALGIKFLRFDMSEYGERHTVSRLIGAPPGYVGFEQEGLLSDQVLKHPHAVLLLDEIEKAHSDIWNILLQIMDYGTLTDHNGRKVDFRNIIIIMTSNVGSREMERRPIGMSDTEHSQSSAQTAVEREFSPEFRNRLDGVIYFHSLSEEAVKQVVNKQIVELESQLILKNVEIEFTEEVRKWLALKGYDKKMGARPMYRLIHDVIKKRLSEELLFGRLINGGCVVVNMKDDKPDFTITPNTKKPDDSKARKKTVSEPVY